MVNSWHDDHQRSQQMRQFVNAISERVKRLAPVFADDDNAKSRDEEVLVEFMLKRVPLLLSYWWEYALYSRGKARSRAFELITGEIIFAAEWAFAHGGVQEVRILERRINMFINVHGGPLLDCTEDGDITVRHVWDVSSIAPADRPASAFEAELCGKQRWFVEMTQIFISDTRGD
jgi:hypothetical protein